MIFIGNTETGEARMMWVQDVTVQDREKLDEQINELFKKAIEKTIIKEICLNGHPIPVNS